MANPVVKLSASITRHYGRVSASFGAEMEFTVDSNNRAGASYYKLVSLIHHQFDEFEANQLPREEMANTPDHLNHGAGQGIPNTPVEWFEAVSLVKGLNKGKWTYNIITKEAAFAKHGVPCYPEFLDEYHLIEYIGDKTELMFEPGTKVMVDKTGKYKKALKLQHPSKVD